MEKRSSTCGQLKRHSHQFSGRMREKRLYLVAPLCCASSSSYSTGACCSCSSLSSFSESYRDSCCCCCCCCSSSSSSSASSRDCCSRVPTEDWRALTPRTFDHNYNLRGVGVGCANECAQAQRSRGLPSPGGAWRLRLRLVWSLRRSGGNTCPHRPHLAPPPRRTRHLRRSRDSRWSLHM